MKEAKTSSSSPGTALVLAGPAADVDASHVVAPPSHTAEPVECDRL